MHSMSGRLPTRAITSGMRPMRDWRLGFAHKKLARDAERRDPADRISARRRDQSRFPDSWWHRHASLRPEYDSHHRRDERSPISPRPSGVMSRSTLAARAPALHGRDPATPHFYELALVGPDCPTRCAVYTCGYSDQLDASTRMAAFPVPTGPGLGVDYDWELYSAPMKRRGKVFKL